MSSAIEEYCPDMSYRPGTLLRFDKNNSNKEERCRAICLDPDGVSGEGAGEPELCSDSNGGYTQCRNSTAFSNLDNPTSLEECCRETLCQGSATVGRLSHCYPICPKHKY